MNKKIYCNLAKNFQILYETELTSIILPHDDDEAHSVVFHSLPHTYVCVDFLLLAFQK